jgi:DNA-binding NarL/FixJ family response regulator
MTTARILIADDHEVLREGLKSLLLKVRPEWEICGEATDGEEAIRLASELKADVIVLDITMPEMSGLEAAAAMRKLGLALPILIFTTHHSERLGALVRNAGAQGYVLKSQAAHSVVVAIETLLAGGTFFGEPSQQSGSEPEKPEPGTSFFRGIAFAY